tara:strand:- start:295 stop:435 length:141 start_codon:yes stop_codon:yes gene_type:complete
MIKKHKHIYASNVKCKICKQTFGTIQAIKFRNKLLKQYNILFNKNK